MQRATGRRGPRSLSATHSLCVQFFLAGRVHKGVVDSEDTQMFEPQTNNRHVISASQNGDQAAAGCDGSAGSKPAPRSKRGARAVRILGGVALLVVAAVAVASLYEGVAGKVGGVVAPAGRLVDIGGYRLHIDCQGKGSPTVVMDAGLGGASLDWSLVQPSLQETTRVCVYDRAGMGWSDARSAVPSPSRLADELHTLLANSGETGPFVLVGHSLAGKNVRLFAAAYPDEVSGMVLVDARSELIDKQMSAADTEGFNAALKAQASVFSLARKVGLVRLLGAVVIGQPLLSQPIAARMALLETEPTAVEEALAEGVSRSNDDAALSTASLGSLPLVVIAAEQNMTSLAGWAAAQEATARLSTNGRLVVAKGSGHYVQLEQPGLVVAAVKEVVATARFRH